MGSDESHFNVLVESNGQSHKTVSTNHNLFEEKGEPKWYLTDVLLLTSLTNALLLGQTSSPQMSPEDLIYIVHKKEQMSVLCSPGTLQLSPLNKSHSHEKY